MSGQDDTTTYPNLGFNPAPGLPSDVDGLSGALQKSTSSMQEAGQLLNQMRNGSSGIWVGQAGDAFRSHFDEKIVGQLSNAHESLSKAVDVMQGWFKDLNGYKDVASALDKEAGTAKEALAKATSDVANAQNNPAFQLIGKQFQEGPALQQAQNAINEASSVLNDARNAESNAQEQLNSVITRAKQLGEESENSARSYAGKLEDATKGLAAKAPGFFSSMFHDFTSAMSAVGGWIEKHAAAIHSILSTISAVAGLIALITPPPIDAIAGAVALVAGLGAIGMDFANPKTRSELAGLVTGLAHGHLNMTDLKAAAGVGMDILGTIPGVGAVAKGLKGAEAAGDAAKLAEGIPSLVEKVPGLGGDATKAFQGMVDDGSKLEKALSSNAHSVSFVVKQGAKVINGGADLVSKIPVIGSKIPEGFELSQKAIGNLNLAKKTESVVSDAYHDIKQAI
ncbi:MAG TPA: hypothetical protein VGM10_34660 [Actinocrinis sp.]|jgi:hypothetical protein